jgi:uncharacterized protein (TIGR02266 family)
MRTMVLQAELLERPRSINFLLQPPMDDERRTHKRVPILVEVNWEGKAGNYDARTSDLSTGGCFIDTAGQVSEGEIIKFKLELPGGEWLELQGEVTYAYVNVGFGVRFTNLSEAVRKRIDWMIETQSDRIDGKQ